MLYHLSRHLIGGNIMTLKRTLCAAAALAVTATALAVPASAATAKKLLIEPTTTIGEDVNDIGKIYSDNLYCTVNDVSISGFCSISSKDIKKWRESGVFSYTDVTVDGDLDYEHLGGFSDIPMLYNEDADSGSVSKRYVYDFNGSDKLTIKYTTENWAGATSSGYIVQDTVTPDKLTINIIAPDGAATSSEIDLAVDPKDKTQPCFWYIRAIENNSDYVGALLYVDKLETEDDFGYFYGLNLALIKEDGTAETVWSNTVPYFGGLLGISDEYVVFAAPEYVVKGGNSVYAYNISTGEVKVTNLYYGDVRLTNSDGSEADSDATYTLDSVTSIYGDKGIAHYYNNYNGDDAYALVELADGAYAPISGYYAGMYTMDGELYLVKTADGKWGYINSNGELLKTFDDAGEFNGKYAPVINDGKAYLINRNMKRVSEKIDAEGVGTLDNGLYRVTIDGEKYFMTYADADDTAAEEPADETPADDSNAPEDNTPDTAAPDTDNTVSDSETTPAATGDKTNPDTGAGSIAVIAAAAITAAGIIVVSRKQKR